MTNKSNYDALGPEAEVWLIPSRAELCLFSLSELSPVGTTFCISAQHTWVILDIHTQNYMAAVI